MSSLIVKVREVEEVLSHPNADRLEIIQLAGWKVISQKGLRKVGDKVVYFPPDSELSQEWAEKMEIIKYVSPVKKENCIRYRIRAIRLRGESSFGHIHTPDENWEIGTDVSEYYGVSKWEPPLSCVDGDAEKPVPAFHKYTGIENWQNFPDVFSDGEEITVSEKVHGCLKKDSKITMINGEIKNIQDVKIGEKVKSYDGTIFCEDEVVDVIKREITPFLEWYELEFDNGQKLVCTGNHLILTNRGWIPAEEVDIIDNII